MREGVTARQDYFTHFEPSQSVGGAKTADPREKTPDHPQAEHSGEMTSDLERLLLAVLTTRPRGPPSIENMHGAIDETYIPLSLLKKNVL